jgi:hypothetical protein
MQTCSCGMFASGQCTTCGVLVCYRADDTQNCCGVYNKGKLICRGCSKVYWEADRQRFLAEQAAKAEARRRLEEDVRVFAEAWFRKHLGWGLPGGYTLVQEQCHCESWEPHTGPHPMLLKWNWWGVLFEVKIRTTDTEVVEELRFVHTVHDYFRARPDQAFTITSQNDVWAMGALIAQYQRPVNTKPNGSRGFRKRWEPDCWPPEERPYFTRFRSSSRSYY